MIKMTVLLTNSEISETIEDFINTLIILKRYASCLTDVEHSKLINALNTVNGVKTTMCDRCFPDLVLRLSDTLYELGSHNGGDDVEV